MSLTMPAFDYQYTDDDCKYPVTAHWLIHYESTDDGLAIVRKEFMHATVRLAPGCECDIRCMTIDKTEAECVAELRKELDEEILLQATLEHWDTNYDIYGVVA